MEIAQGVYRFDTGPFNWYVIDEGGRLTLVDAGFPGHYRAFVNGIRQLGYDIDNLEAILITHAHADHMGFAERIRKQTNVPVLVHRNDLASIQRPLQLPWFGLLSNAWRPFVRTLLGHATVNGVFRLPPIKNAATFQHGDVLDVPGSPQVLHTPGHTPGEVAFFLPDRGVLLSGDALVTQDLLTGKPTPPQPTHRLLSSNNQEAHQSIRCLYQTGNVTILPGHGSPWVGNIEDAVRDRLATQSG